MSTCCSTHSASLQASPRFAPLAPRRPSREVRPGYDRRFAKDVPLAFDGAGLDLHRTPIAGPLGRRIPVAELLDRRRDIVVGGRAIGMLDLADAYVHAGLTAGAADVPARLITLRDLLELEARPDFDSDAVLARARVWGVEAPLARAVVLLEERLRPDVPPALGGWARRYVAGRLDRFVLRCYVGTARRCRPPLTRRPKATRHRRREPVAHSPATIDADRVSCDRTSDRPSLVRTSTRTTSG